MWLSLAGPELEAETKIKEVVSINQVLAILGQLLESLLFVFLACYLDGRLISYKSALRQAAVLSWLL